MIDVVVISHACFMAINRNIYHLLSKEGLSIEIVVPESLNFPSGLKKAENRTYLDPEIHYLKLKGKNPRTYVYDGLKEILNQKKPKILMLDNDPVSLLAFSVGKWCKANNSYLFCISNENLTLDIFSTFKRRGLANLPAAIFKRILINKTKNLVDVLFCINSFGKEIFANEGFKNVTQIPLGFDSNYFYPDSNKRKQIRKKLGVNKIIIAYFGRLVKEKGVHILIEALHDLMGLDWMFMIDKFDQYSSNFNNKIFNLISKYKMNDRLIFVDPNHYVIASYMNAADIIVSPSISIPQWKEQYGRVAAEAMGCGKIVVASDSGFLPELINNNGYIFPEGNVQALKKILKNLILENNFSLNRTEISNYAKRNLSLIKQNKIMIEKFNQFIN